jgi:hypothetical protein
MLVSGATSRGLVWLIGPRGPSSLSPVLRVLVFWVLLLCGALLGMRKVLEFSALLVCTKLADPLRGGSYR